jgi:hypothetical protein
VLIEYVMLAGINDSEEVAHQLGLLLKDCKVVGHLSFLHCSRTQILNYMVIQKFLGNGVCLECLILLALAYEKLEKLLTLLDVYKKYLLAIWCTEFSACVLFSGC